MQKELLLFSKVLLQDSFSEFEALLSDFEKSDKGDFMVRNRKMLERAGFDLEDSDGVDDTLIFQCFAIQEKRMACVDWSGEEYTGQIMRSITNMLNSYGLSNFKWNRKKFDDSLDFNEIRRGDYVPLLLSAIDKALAEIGYRIAIFDDDSDMYNYCLLTEDNLHAVNGMITDRFSIIDTKMYAVYLNNKEATSGKILLYLKNKFGIPLSEVKVFAEQPLILLIQGNLKTVSREQAEVEKIGGVVTIEEIIFQ